MIEEKTGVGLGLRRERPTPRGEPALGARGHRDDWETAMPDSAKGQCFVIMGFGKKTDFETGRTLDLDKTYANIIKPAANGAGLECVRADEIVHAGAIDLPIFELLLNA